MSAYGEGIRARRSPARGAGLTEYLLVIAGISIAAAATFSAFGDTIRHQTAGMALELAGMDSADAIAGAVAAAERARGAAAAGSSFFGGDSAGGGAGGGGVGDGGGFDPSLPFQPPGSSGGGGSDGSVPPSAMCPAGGDNSPQSTSTLCDSEMTLSAAGEAWLKKIEKLALDPYDDQKGIAGEPITEWVKGATIGYGHLISKKNWPRFKDGITKEEAELQFQVDIGPYVDKVNEIIAVDLEQHEFDALVIFAYNIGEAGFASSSVAKLINDPEADTPYRDLESAWKAWNKSQKKVNQGLINRRAAEWHMYSTGGYRHW